MDHSASVQVTVCLVRVMELNDQPTLGFVRFTLCPEDCFDRRVSSWVVSPDARLTWCEEGAQRLNQMQSCDTVSSR